MWTCAGEDVSVLCSPSVTVAVRLWKGNAQESEIKRNRLESCQIEDGAKGESLNEMDGKLCVPQGLSGLKPVAYNWPRQDGPHLQSQHSGDRNSRVIASSRLILVNRLPPEQLKATDPQQVLSP